MNWCLAQEPIDPSKITIARDKWGTPHIFAKTDAEVAYGLAWSNAEDAFDRMQEFLLIGKGLMGRWKGKEGAAYDFFSHAIGTEKTYNEHINEISDEYLSYLDGYCQGINAYAAAHPEQVIEKRAFPVVPKDVFMTYIIAFSALSGGSDRVESIMKGEYDKEPKSTPAGSNAYAFNVSKTTDGKTYLAINPHFKIDGAFSFYDAHLCSEEGLNIVGALFQAGSCVFMGNNEHLGWGHTYNHMDLTDVFELKMHPSKKLWYEFDGEYIKLEKRPIWLKVRLGKIILPVKKMTYWSKYGPTLRSPKKRKRFYAVRSGAFFNLKAGEQFYRMNKATNFEEFKTALNIQGLSMFNLVYADKKDNIYYLCNGALPKRNADFDYSKNVIGNSSESLWTEYYSVDELPHVENPNCGYVFNMNNTPTNASCDGENYENPSIIEYADLRPGENNRSTRFMEILEEKESFSFEEFKAIKFDTKITKNSNFFKSLKNLHAIEPKDYPDLEEAIKLLQAWDGDASLENTTAALFMVTLHYIFKKKNYDDAQFVLGVSVDEETYIECIEKATKYLTKHHESIEVPLAKINCHERSGKMYQAAGFPDAMSPFYGEPQEDGRFRAMYGDTYIHFVKFGQDGSEQIETLLPFEATVTSEDYEDELQMFNNRELKTMSLDKEEVMKSAVKVYHPVANGANK
ncbi:MAG: penicillin acylase family protein [Saprospiraceae bacterium]|nr:penicillin acylase family protein [Saprospiraceae bacterium]